MQIRSSARSDVGRGRAHNEDFFIVAGEQGCFAVADGMGGHGNGDIASRLATETIQDVFGGQSKRGSRLADRLRRSIEEANRRVYEAASHNADLSGMGATAVAMAFAEGKGFLGSVGDSRAYLLRGGGLRQLTDDHTWVREQISAGRLSEAQARKHPFRSVVTRALGGDETIEVDMRELDPRAGDLYLLCSDGLNAVLSDDEIRDRLEPDQSLSTLCSRLIDAANARGGPDNITVVLVAIEDSVD